MESIIRRIKYFIDSMLRRYRLRFESILRRNTLGKLQGKVMRKQADFDQFVYRQQDKVLGSKKKGVKSKTVEDGRTKERKDEGN